MICVFVFRNMFYVVMYLNIDIHFSHSGMWNGGIMNGSTDIACSWYENIECPIHTLKKWSQSRALISMN